MTETLYLIIERTRRRGWRGPQISRVCKRKPVLARPSEQALVRLNIQIPDRVLEPRVVNIELKPEDIAVPAVTVTAARP